MGVCICVGVWVHGCMQVCVSVCLRVCVSVCVCLCLCLCVCVWVFAFQYAYAACIIVDPQARIGVLAGMTASMNSACIL